MSSHIPASLRRLVAERAAYRCEYCGQPSAVALHPHEPDHIVPSQHGGTPDESNFALACFPCNRYKGPNAGSFDPITEELVPFFNPRTQRWDDHFAWNGARVEPRTAEARVTVRIFRLNDPERVAERERLMRAGLY